MIFEKRGCIVADIKYKIVKHLTVLAEGSKRWKKELNLISWNGNEPKYGIRERVPEHAKMGKDVTLSKDEVVKLKDILIEIEHKSLA